MGKPFRHIELAMVFRRQFHARPLPERGRIGPDVDSDIKYTPFQDGNELTLGFGVLECSPRITPGPDLERLDWTNFPGSPTAS